jgi:hypothetical protein
LLRVFIAEFVILRIENRAFHQDGTRSDVVRRALSMDIMCCCVEIGGGNPEKVATL